MYQGRVPAEADLVCYWFVKAEHLAASQAKRAGLVSTNSIRGGANRRALQAAIKNRPIFEAWADEPRAVAIADASRRGRGEGPEEAYTDEPLKRPPAVARGDAHAEVDAAVAAAYGLAE